MRADLTGRLERLLGVRPAQVRIVGGQHGVDHYRVVLADGRLVFVKAVARGPDDEAVARGPDDEAVARGPDDEAVARGQDVKAVARGPDSPADDGDAAAVLHAEASGLRWLAEAGAVPVPEVLGCDGRMLAISWVPQEQPSRLAAERFGRDLARLHAAGASRLGAPWRGFIAGLPLGNADGNNSNADGSNSNADGSNSNADGSNSNADGSPDSDTSSGAWPQWYARERLLPFARRARDSGQLGPADVRLVEAVADRLPELAGPAEPPSRIHGDCWSGNVLWSGGRGALIDPAAHGGHRETDLAMLALFGAPSLERILAAYQEAAQEATQEATQEAAQEAAQNAAPLADGWRNRVPLHQLHPLLVHVCLFGAGYREAMLGAARAALSG